MRRACESHATTHTPVTKIGGLRGDSPNGLVAGSPNFKKSGLRRRPREGRGAGSQNESEMNDLVIGN